MTTITFKYPAATRRRGKEPALKEAQGRVAIIQVGEQKVRFVLQLDHTGTRVDCLTHFASGMIVGYLSDEKVRAMVSRGNHCQLTDHQAARSLVARLIDKHGLGVVQHKLAGAPIINT